MCVVDFDFVVAPETRVEEIALTLVHEGTHARLHRLGLGYEERIRARIERLCIGSELVVARRLPGAEALVASAEARLAWPDETWSDASVRERRLGALLDMGWAGRLGYRIGRVFARP